MRHRFVGLLIAIGAGVAVACSSKGEEAAPPPPPKQLSHDGMINAAVCANCHPNAYREWSGSMHAYAGDDPLFRAMNARMIRETKGANPTLCVGCHAPVALRTGATTDGTNLANVPAELRGVTCFFCHTADHFQAPLQNNAIVSGDDKSFGASIANPMEGAPHGVRYSSFLDQTNEQSTPTCGGCHDIVVPAGAAIERTFEEWKKSRFGLQEERSKTSCGNCHMPGREGLAANVPGAPTRTIHDHSMVAVDLALTPFDETAAQRAGVQKLLDTAVRASLCVQPNAGGVDVSVELTNDAVGHRWPSGSNQDRRAWVKLEAFRDGARVYAEGDVPDDKAVESSLGADPLFLLRDVLYDGTGKRTHMFWEAARYDASSLPPATTTDPTRADYAHGVKRSRFLVGAPPDEIRMEVRIRPVDYDLVEDLAATGDLDPKTIPPLTTFTLAPTKLAWSLAGGFGCITQ